MDFENKLEYNGKCDRVQFQVKTIVYSGLQQNTINCGEAKLYNTTNHQRSKMSSRSRRTAGASWEAMRKKHGGYTVSETDVPFGTLLLHPSSSTSAAKLTLRQ
jgi:hypothetical protein